MKLEEDLKAEAYHLGFSLCGISRPAPPRHMKNYQAWIHQGFHGEMAYLSAERAIQVRNDPRLLMPGLQSIIHLGIQYPHPSLLKDPEDDQDYGRISSYAWEEDYHKTLPLLAHKLTDQLEKIFPGQNSFLIHTDSGPILERELAQTAGLGWVGKNSCLIHPDIGSFFFLGEIFSDVELQPDTPFPRDSCGSCQRCIHACPTGCIREDRMLDARRCISYLTIENNGAIPIEMRRLMTDRVFGCDICQQVCPWNEKALRAGKFNHFSPELELAYPSLEFELTSSHQMFNQKYGHRPVARAKHRGFLRNLALAAGNAARPELVPALTILLNEENEPLVRSHAAWALGRMDRHEARDSLIHASRTELDTMVKIEIDSALNGQLF